MIHMFVSIIRIYKCRSVQVAIPWQAEVTWSLRARHVSSPEERSGVKPTTKRSWTYLKQEKMKDMSDMLATMRQATVKVYNYYE